MQYSRMYHLLFDEAADPRVKTWYLMSSPKPLLCIIIAYLVGLKIAKVCMEKKEAFDLRRVILIYNLFQILGCLFILHGMATSGWTSEYDSWICQSVDYSNDPQAVKMLRFTFYAVFLKLVEFAETFIFIFRKKFNQVSTLHVYHHVYTLITTWVLCKYSGGGTATFPLMLNLFVHVIMYSYYLVASRGPKWQRLLAKWKPRITALQMVQFCVMIGYAGINLSPDCPTLKPMVLIFIPNILVMLNMFWNFYRKSYRLKHEDKVC